MKKPLKRFHWFDVVLKSAHYQSAQVAPETQRRNHYQAENMQKGMTSVSYTRLHNSVKRKPDQFKNHEDGKLAGILGPHS